MSKIHSDEITFDDSSLLPLLFGEHNSHIDYLEEKLDVKITDRGSVLIVEGEKENVKSVKKVFKTLEIKAQKRQDVSTADIDAALRFSTTDKKIMKKSTETAIQTRKKPISPRSPNQAEYVNLIRNHDLVFGLGPAGTGKTYLAVAMGVSLFLEGEVERLIFCRPAVEAGENLGFLPGDMREKIDPYLRPIYDALQDMLPADQIEKKMAMAEIEIAPLAFMRGRTLSNAFVILDEAQNTTATQMQMFLTRLGENSRMVITGDLSQVDLPRNVKSGLRDALETLEGVEDIASMQFTSKDVVRHGLVAKIVEAYEKKAKDHNY